jgi:hypothetical protein
MMAKRQDDPQEQESRRILERVSMEESGGTVLGRTAERIRDHVAASDADRNDWAEYWGTRIGRTLGLIITVVLIAWLFLYLLGAG